MAFVRIDNRLVHGQIIETWLPFTRARVIVVVNDALAADFLRQEIMSLAIPAGVRIEFLPVAGLLPFLTRTPGCDDALILFSNCHDARNRLRRGFGFTALNWAISITPRGKSRFAPMWPWSREDECCLDFFRDRGVRLDYRCVPSDPPS